MRGWTTFTGHTEKNYPFQVPVIRPTVDRDMNAQSG